MLSVEFDTTENLTTLAKATLRQAVREVFGSAPVNFVRKKNALLHFGVTAPSATEMAVKGDARAVATAIRNALPKSPKTPWDGIYAPETILYLDIETHEAERMWDMPLREFFRLGQFAWGPEGDIGLTTDLDEVLDACKRANGIVAHNGHQFDFSVLFGDEALKYARAGKLFDTMLFANLAFPAPYMFKMRPKEGGKPRTVITEGKPEMVSLWLSLDNLAYQLNVDGKEGDLKALAKEFGGFGLIPTNDPRYEDYARGDIRMLQAITTNLISMHPVSQYDRREQLKGAIAAQMSRNGFRVNIPAAKARVAELAERKEVLLADLDARYGFPTEGKMPWRTNKGKEAILNALADYGITPETRPSWPQLKTGPSLGGKVLLELTEDTEAEELGITLAELQGQRSLAQQALDYVHDDSRVHPSITLWQRSGRSSITKPGLTTWGERNPIDKGYLVASEGHKLVEFDLSNADQRIVAALSGDTEYAKRFLPGVDGHEISGRLMFGNAAYDTDPKAHRTIAKSLSHAYAYGAGSKKLAATAKQPLDLAEKFVDAMKRAYPGVIAWQNRVRAEGEKGSVRNRWGRVMQIDRDSAYTQAPAAFGQSGTAEIIWDGLIEMLERDERLIKWVVCMIHDALLFDFPEDQLDYAVPMVVECMEQNINGIEFPVGHGPAGDTWQDARHG